MWRLKNSVSTQKATVCSRGFFLRVSSVLPVLPLPGTLWRALARRFAGSVSTPAPRPLKPPPARGGPSVRAGRRAALRRDAGRLRRGGTCGRFAAQGQRAACTARRAACCPASLRGSRMRAASGSTRASRLSRGAHSPSRLTTIGRPSSGVTRTSLARR